MDQERNPFKNSNQRQSYDCMQQIFRNKHIS